MEKVVCEICGKQFEMSEYEKKLRKCQWCGKTICFDCTHYMVSKNAGLHKDNNDVIRVCTECQPKVKEQAD
ncbi:MAG: FYVE zinc finger domain-containing protein [Thermoplasmata archaeon]